MSGRLIRKSAYCGDSKSTAYIVAVDEAAEAIDLIKQKVAEPGDDIEDLGLVTDGLLQTLNLPAGSFAILDQGRASAPRLAASDNHEGE
jgi:beta-galactosidase beta subunit